MTDIILHHYAVSPFAEKIRAILGYKRLAWRSVDIPPVMPKPDLTALTGGYRKTPVLQRRVLVVRLDRGRVRHRPASGQLSHRRGRRGRVACDRPRRT